MYTNNFFFYKFILSLHISPIKCYVYILYYIITFNLAIYINMKKKKEFKHNPIDHDEKNKKFCIAAFHYNIAI